MMGGTAKSATTSGAPWPSRFRTVFCASSRPYGVPSAGSPITSPLSCVPRLQLEKVLVSIKSGVRRIPRPADLHGEAVKAGPLVLRVPDPPVGAGETRLPTVVHAGRGHYEAVFELPVRRLRPGLPAYPLADACGARARIGGKRGDGHRVVFRVQPGQFGPVLRRERGVPIFLIISGKLLLDARARRVQPP